MATKQTVLTKEGLKNLENELEHLKSVTRKEIAEKIKTARGFGDLSENSEYDEAKNEQGIVEARIAEIEATLMNVRVLDEDELTTEHVSVGNKVILESLDDGKVLKISLVGSKEVDVKEMKLSDESPIGKACIGKKLGEEITVEAPMGIKKYIIKEIDK
ncbi:MAG: transcription elongation factor GreA [Ruminiclostridium sp.]|jgi:transcription elongation factor GreA|nr:transcription elongation factor GreA [Ruminiclostridium sp.]